MTKALQLDRLSMADLHALGCALDRLQRVGEVLAEAGEFIPVFSLEPGVPALMLPPVFASAAVHLARRIENDLAEFPAALISDPRETQLPAAEQTGTPNAGAAEMGRDGGGVAAPPPVAADNFEAEPVADDGGATCALRLAEDTTDDGGAVDHMVANEAAAETFPEAAPVANGEVAESDPPAPGKAAGEGRDSALPPTAAPAPGSRDGMLWEPWEDDVIRAGRAVGDGWAAIAERIGRNRNSTSVRWYGKLRDAPVGARLLTDPAPVPVPAPVPPPSPVISATAAAADLSIPAWKRHLDAHLDALGSPENFSPARDLAMVEGLFRGRSLASFADEHDLPMLEVKERYFALRASLVERGEMTVENQKRLIAALRARLPAEARAAE